MSQENFIIEKQRKRARPSKVGRDQIGCQRYRERGTREKNRLKKLNRILKLQPHNLQVRSLLNSLS